MLVNFFKWNLAWKEKHAIRTCIFKDWNPGGGEGWKALLLCTASWNQTQIKADFSQECEALSDGWIPHVSHLHHQIPASVSTSTGYHTAVPTATSAIRNWKKKLKKKNHWNAPDKPLSFSYHLLMQSPSLPSNFNHTSYFRLKTESKPERYCTYNTYYFFRAIKPARQINHKRHLLFFSSALPSKHANR